MRAILLAALSVSCFQVQGHEGHEHPPAGKVVTSVQKTGNGRFLFETVPGFGEMPDGGDIGPTHGGVAVDGEGNVYVSTEAKHGVVKFSGEGEYLTSFGPETAHLHSLELVKEGDKELLIGASSKFQKLVKMDLEGQVLLMIPNEETGEVPGGFKGATGVSVGPEGNIFLVCGYGSNKIHKFSPAGKLLKSAGGRGKDEGKFMTCHGIAVDYRGEKPLLLICDRENRRLVHMDLDLEFQSVYTTHLRRPCAVSIRDNLTAVAELEGRVTVLGEQGQPVAFLGDQPNKKLWAKKPIPAEKLYDGLFTSPHGLSWDNEGNIIVQDWNKIGRVTKLKRLK